MRKLTFGIDFDGTIVSHDFPEIGIVYPEAIRIMKLMQSRGHDIILFTCREDCERAYLTEALDTLSKVGVIPNSVNENTPYYVAQGYTSRKPYWDLLIDDSAGFDPSLWWHIEDRMYDMELNSNSLDKYGVNKSDTKLI